MDGGGSVEEAHLDRELEDLFDGNNVSDCGCIRVGLAVVSRLGVEPDFEFLEVGRGNRCLFTVCVEILKKIALHVEVFVNRALRIVLVILEECVHPFSSVQRRRSGGSQSPHGASFTQMFESSWPSQIFSYSGIVSIL